MKTYITSYFLISVKNFNTALSKLLGGKMIVANHSLSTGKCLYYAKLFKNVSVTFYYKAYRLCVICM